ncbi:TerC family protein [Niallia nealsonii]|uniref:Uncharacterized protein n=1 Tax=Niallia nealsonii TaxID=115979 RepID=A0A2N0Z6G8_9BACI|nr:hypothetical protein [Niallia nealsonii]PKG25115.1 hypothetical protein CWS01_03180 [Niallia nealsonii]
MLKKRPSLKTSAFVVVAWAGVKLAVYALSHPEPAIISKSFGKSTTWKIIFWSLLLLIGILGWILSKPKEGERKQTAS